MNLRWCLSSLVWAACALPLTSLAPPVRAAIQPLAPDQSAYGLTRAEWLEAFVEWWGSLPDSASSWMDLDSRGVLTGVGQHGPVWFLPTGYLATDYSRMVTIPAGKAVYVGVIFSLARAVPGARTEAELLQAAELSSRLGQFTRIEAKLNGTSIGDVRQYRVQTPVFSINPPPGNWFEHPVTAGKDARLAVAADGIFLLFPPLPAGSHVISLEYEGNGGDGMGQEGKPFKAAITYTLQVQKPNEPLP